MDIPWIESQAAPARVRRLARGTSFALLALLAAPSGAELAQDGPALHLSEDLDLVGATGLCLAAPRDESVEHGAAQADRFVFHGSSQNPGGAFDWLDVVGAVSSSGELLWTWLDDQSTGEPQDLFVPRDADISFAVLERVQQTLEVRRFAVDGAVDWVRTLGAHSSFDYGNRALLAGSRSGQRLFLMCARLEGWPIGARPVMALDVATGATLWSRSIALNTDPVALVSDDAGARVYALSEAGKFNDRLLAVDGATGAQLWDVSVSIDLGQLSTVRTLACAPDGSRVYVGAEPSSSIGGEPTLLALDGATGAALWTASLPDNAVQIEVDETGPYLYLATRTEESPWYWDLDLRVASVNAANGHVRWSRLLPTQTSGSPYHVRAAHDPSSNRLALAYTTSTGDDLLVALDAQDGATRWEQPLPHVSGEGRLGALDVLQAGGGSSFVLGRRLDRFGSGDLDAVVQAFAHLDGASQWTAGASFEAVIPTALGLAADGGEQTVFALARDAGGRRTAAAFERSDFAPRWSTALDPDLHDFSQGGPGDRIAVTPDGRVALTSSMGAMFLDPRLEGLDGATGAQLWTREFGDHGQVVDLLPDPAGQAVYAIHGTDPQFVGQPAMRALNPDTGADLWVQSWPASGFGSRCPAGALAADGSRLAALVVTGSDSTLVVRSAADGALTSATTLTGADFGIALGGINGVDVELSGSGAAAFLAIESLGTVATQTSCCLARLATQNGAVDWTAVVPTALYASLGPGELHLPASGKELLLAARYRPSADDERTILLSVDAQSGALRWQRVLGDLGAPRPYEESALDESGRTLIVSTRDPASGAAILSGFDVHSGTLLWEATLESGSAGADSLGALLPAGASILALGGSDAVVPVGEVSLTELRPEALVSGPMIVSIANPADAVFLLDRPAGSAGELYLLLGTASGTSPGLPLGEHLLPLVPDAYFLMTLTGANQPPFRDTLGVLDPAGDGRAELAVPVGLNPSLAGTRLHHAFVELSALPAVSFASEAVTTRLGP